MPQVVNDVTMWMTSNTKDFLEIQPNLALQVIYALFSIPPLKLQKLVRNTVDAL